VTNVAVLDKGYLGGGARETQHHHSLELSHAARRSRSTRSVKLYERLAGELDFNVMFSSRDI
jgi:hypothetical protein